MNESSPYDMIFQHARPEDRTRRAAQYLDELRKYLKPPYTFDSLRPDEDRHRTDPHYHNVGRNNVKTVIMGYLSLALNDPHMGLGPRQRASLQQSLDSIKALPTKAVPTPEDLVTLKQAIIDAVTVLEQLEDSATSGADLAASDGAR